MKAINQVLDLLGPHKKRLYVIFVLVVIGEISTVFWPYIYGKIVDSLTVGGDQQEIFFLVLLGFIVAFISTFFKQYQELDQFTNFTLKMRGYLGGQTMLKLSNLSVGQHREGSSGKKFSAMIEGESSVIQFADTIIIDSLIVIIRVGLILLALFWLDIKLASIVLVGVIIFAIVSYVFEGKFTPLITEVRKERHVYFSKRGEYIKNMGEVILNNQQASCVSECALLWSGISAKMKKVWTKYEWSQLMRNVVVLSTQFCVMAVGVILVFDNQITVGQYVMFMFWALSVFSGLNAISGIQRQYLELSAEIEIYSEMIGVPTDVEEGQITSDNFKSGDIDFCNVTYRYPEAGGDNTCGAVNDVSLHVAEGSKVAFVGSSGSGKSTMIHLLTRGTDTQTGSITIGGTNIKNLSFEALRGRMGLVSQNPVMLDDTLANNITFSVGEKRDAVTYEDLKKVAEMSRIDVFFNRLPNGFETNIGEDGVKLSGGECQRVALARALIKNPEIIIFDEATSSLDTVNEVEIMKEVDKEYNDKTMIVIAHRLSTVKNADKIIVFDKGRIVDEGTHDELLDSSDVYKALINAQNLK